MFNEGILPLEKDSGGLSWWIVHVSGQDNLAIPLKISWASAYVMNQVLENQASKDINKLKEVSCLMLKSPPRVRETDWLL